MSTENLEKLREALANDDNISSAETFKALGDAAIDQFGHRGIKPSDAALLGYRSRDAEVAELVDALNRWLVADKVWLETGDKRKSNDLFNYAHKVTSTILAKHAKAGKEGA